MATHETYTLAVEYRVDEAGLLYVRETEQEGDWHGIDDRPPTREQAMFAAHAANCHHQLLTALRQLLSACEQEMPDRIATNPDNAYGAAQNSAVAAITAAEKTS